jgi:hypothetical protein
LPWSSISMGNNDHISKVRSSRPWLPHRAGLRDRAIFGSVIVCQNGRNFKLCIT